MSHLLVLILVNLVECVLKTFKKWSFKYEIKHKPHKVSIVSDITMSAKGIKCTKELQYKDLKNVFSSIRSAFH